MVLSSDPSGWYRARARRRSTAATQMFPWWSMVSPSGTASGVLMCTTVRRAAQAAGGRVEVERADVTGAAVGEVHRGALGAPADPVGDRQAGQHLRAAAVEFEPVQGPGARCFVVGHGAGPEPPLRVASPVVHPDVGAAGFGLGQLADPARVIDVQESGPGGQHVSAAAAGAAAPRWRSNWNVCSTRSWPSAPGRATVQPPGQDIYPQQLVTGPVPARTLAGRPGLGRAGRHRPGILGGILCLAVGAWRPGPATPARIRIDDLDVVRCPPQGLLGLVGAPGATVTAFMHPPGNCGSAADGSSRAPP